MTARTSLTPTARAILWAMASMAAFATVPIGVRVASSELAPAVIASLRNFIGFAAMLPFVLTQGPVSGWRSVRPQRFHLHLLRAVMNGIGMVLWFWGLSRIPVADAVALQFTLPLFALLFAVAFLGERIGIRRAGAMAIGFLGALVILRPGFADINLATFGVLASAALYGATVVVVRSQSQKEAATTVMFWGTLLMGAVTLVPALPVWTWPSAAMWPWLLFVAAGGWAAQYTLTRALRLADTKVVAPFDFLRLPLVALVAFPMFGEFPDALTWAGAAIIAFAASYIAHRDAKAARARNAEAGLRVETAP